VREEKLDCRGLACPSPVLQTKAVVDRGDVAKLTVLVDNDAARENVSRFLQNQGYTVIQEMREGSYALTGVRLGSEPALITEVAATSADTKILVLVGTDKLGRGDDVLGGKLLQNFLITLKEMGKDLWRLVLLNAGVKLAVTGSEVLASLMELEAAQVQILVCGTCLDHFQLLDQKQVGETTNMLDIVTSMQLADKVISLT